MALQYVVKTYIHTKIVNYIKNTKYLDESKIPKKFKHKKFPTTSLTISTMISWGWNFSLYPTTSLIGLKWKVPKTFKSPRSLIIDTFSLKYFAIKFFFLNLNKGNNQGVLTWKMHGGPSITSIVVLMWISKAHVVATLHKLQKYNPLEGYW